MKKKYWETNSPGYTENDGNDHEKPKWPTQYMGRMGKTNLPSA